MAISNSKQEKLKAGSLEVRVAALEHVCFLQNKHLIKLAGETLKKEEQRKARLEANRKKAEIDRRRGRQKREEFSKLRIEKFAELYPGWEIFDELHFWSESERGEKCRIALKRAKKKCPDYLVKLVQDYSQDHDQQDRVALKASIHGMVIIVKPVAQNCTKCPTCDGLGFVKGDSFQTLTEGWAERN